MYKELKKQIADHKVIRTTRIGIENRMQFKIDKQLGLKGVSYPEVKIQFKNNTDKFAKVFSELEDLDNQRETLLEEETIIDNALKQVDEDIKVLNDIELNVFRWIYMKGLTQKQTAMQETYSIQRIKQIHSDIKNKIRNKKNED